MLAKKGEPTARPTTSAILDSVPSDLTLGDQIGKGSYGSVYSAMFVGRRVAVKAGATARYALPSAMAAGSSDEPTKNRLRR